MPATNAAGCRQQLACSGKLRQRFDPQVVAVWLGHSESISTKHDTQVRPEDFAAAVSGRVAEKRDPQRDPQACETGKTGAKAKSKTREKTNVFRGSADLFANVRDGLMLRQGFEP